MTMKRNGKSQATMDRFVVRSSKVSPPVSPTKNNGVLRQATLESLKGVVVVEEMERARVVLERTDVSTELKVDTLKHLLCKTPAKEVLIRTKLGKTVHKLCRVKEAEVATLAQQVYTAWKKHILSKVNRPYIEVKCDLKTQKLRNSARRMLLEALQKENERRGGGENRKDHKSNREQIEVEDCQSSRDSERYLETKETKQSRHEPKQKQVKNSEGKSKRNSTQKRPRKDSDTEEYIHNTKQKMDEEEEEEEEKSEDTRGCKKTREDNSYAHHDSIEMLAEHLEQKVYQNSQRWVDIGYRRTIRSLVFTLIHKKDIRKAVVSATITVEDFVKQYKKN